jgi:hypothetical protein
LGLAVAGRACMVLLIFLLFELLFDFGDGWLDMGTIN